MLVLRELLGRRAFSKDVSTPFQLAQHVQKLGRLNWEGVQEDDSVLSFSTWVV